MALSPPFAIRQTEAALEAAIVDGLPLEAARLLLVLRGLVAEWCAA